MKKTLIGLVVLSSLAGCTVERTVERVVTETTVPVTTPSSSLTISEQAFLGTLRDEYPLDTNGVSDEDLLGLGEALCIAISGGITYEGLLQVAEESLLNADLAFFAAGAAVAVLCPENEWWLPA